jgi:hypothetical protein
VASQLARNPFLDSFRVGDNPRIVGFRIVGIMIVGIMIVGFFSNVLRRL